MTTETPCRYPECECDVTGGRCPNAKPAEPPACGCHGPCGSADCCERCAEPQGSEGSEPLRGLSKGSALGLANAQRREAELLAPLKAEIAALKAERDALRDRLTTAEKCVSAAKSVIDGMEREIGGAHVDIMHKVAENAALKARVEELNSVVLRANAGRFNGSVIGTEARAIRAELERSSEDLAEARLFTSLQTAALENRNEELAIAKAEIGRLEELLLEWADHGSSDDLLGEARTILTRKEQEASNGKVRSRPWRS